MAIKLEKSFLRRVLNKQDEGLFKKSNIKAAFFKLGTSNVHHKKQNDIYNVVAMATLLALVSFCKKTNIPIRTALIFLELFLIECCAVLVEPPMTLSLSSFA